MRVLVTRPQLQAENSAEALRRRGHVPIVCPVTVIESLDAPPATGAFDAVAATSANALRHADRAGLAGLQTVPFHGVGEGTILAAQAIGFVELRRSAGGAAELAQSIAASLPTGARLLYLAGDPRKPDFERILASAGISLVVQVCYRAVPASELLPQASAVLAAGQIDAILHYSAESARRFCSLAAAAGLADQAASLLHACLSADVARGIDALPAARIAVAARPDEGHLLALLDNAH